MADGVTSYPTSIDSFATTTAGVSRSVAPTESDRFNKLQTGMVAVQTQIGATQQTVATIAALRASLTKQGVATVLGYYAAGDAGAAWSFTWSSGSTATDDGFSVYLPTGHSGAGRWLIVPLAEHDARQAGCRADGTTDDAATFQAAMTWTAANSRTLIVTGTVLLGSRVTATSGTNFALRSRTGATIKAKSGAWGAVGRHQVVHILDSTDVVVEGITFDANSAGTTSTDYWAIIAFETTVADLNATTVTAKRFTFQNNRIINLRSYGCVVRLADQVVMRGNRGEGAAVGSVGFLRAVRSNNVDFLNNFCDSGVDGLTFGQTGSWISVSPGNGGTGTWNSASEMYQQAINFCSALPYLERGQFTAAAAGSATSDTTVSYSAYTETTSPPTYITNEFYFTTDTAGSGSGAGIHNGTRMKVISVNEGAETFVVRLYDHDGVATNWAGQQVSWYTIKTSRFCRNINVIGNTLRRSGEGGVFLLGCDTFKTSGNFAHEHSDICLDAEWCINGDISNNVVEQVVGNTGIGVLFLQRNIRVSDNTLSGGKADIMSYTGWTPSIGVTISGNVLVGANIQCAPQYAQAWDDLTEELVITNNTVIASRNSSNVSVGGGIKVDVEGSAVRGGRHRNVTIRGNTIQGRAQRSIHLSGVQGATIEDNLFVDNLYDAVYIGGTVTTQESTGVVVRRNRLDNIGKAYAGGMAILRTGYANTEDPIIEDNVWSNTDTALNGTQPDYIKNGSTTTARRSPLIRTTVAQTGVSGAAVVFSSLHAAHSAALIGNVTGWSISGTPAANQEIEIQWIQDATGSRTLAGAPGTVKYAGAALTLSTTANRVDTLKFRFNGTNWIEISRSMNVG